MSALPQNVRTPSEFEERVVQIDRVARVVKGGRRFRFRATVVIGDRKRRVGLGVAKAGEVQGAIQKAIAVAKKEMITVKVINDTIPFAITSQFAGAKLLLKPARPGTGIIAGGAVRPIVELAGITNILSKSLGSDNRINNAKATLKALAEIANTDISKIAPDVVVPAVTEAPAEPELAAATSAAEVTDTEPSQSVKHESDKKITGTKVSPTNVATKQSATDTAVAEPTTEPTAAKPAKAVAKAPSKKASTTKKAATDKTTTPKKPSTTKAAVTKNKAS